MIIRIIKPRAHADNFLDHGISGHAQADNAFVCILALPHRRFNTQLRIRQEGCPGVITDLGKKINTPACALVLHVLHRRTNQKFGLVFKRKRVHAAHAPHDIILIAAAVAIVPQRADQRETIRRPELKLFHIKTGIDGIMIPQAAVFRMGVFRGRLRKSLPFQRLIERICYVLCPRRKRRQENQSRQQNFLFHFILPVKILHVLSTLKTKL